MTNHYFLLSSSFSYLLLCTSYRWKLFDYSSKHTIPNSEYYKTVRIIIIVQKEQIASVQTAAVEGRVRVGGGNLANDKYQAPLMNFKVSVFIKSEVYTVILS